MDTPSKEIDEKITKFCSKFERLSWVHIVLSMLTQLSPVVAFPAYNLVLGFWGVYCAFSKSNRALFGYITFLLFSIILDVSFCGVYGGTSSETTFVFALIMFIACLITKIPAAWYSSVIFTNLGGMEKMNS